LAIPVGPGRAILRISDISTLGRGSIVGTVVDGVGYGNRDPAWAYGVGVRLLVVVAIAIAEIPFPMMRGSITQRSD
jgi:hypothetical protein